MPNMNQEMIEKMLKYQQAVNKDEILPLKTMENPNEDEEAFDGLLKLFIGGLNYLSLQSIF